MIVPPIDVFGGRSSYLKTDHDDVLVIKSNITKLRRHSYPLKDCKIMLRYVSQCQSLLVDISKLVTYCIQIALYKGGNKRTIQIP